MRLISPTAPATDMVLLYVPCRDAAEAEKLLRGALAEKLAACGHIGAAISSIYAWQGKIEQTQEVPLLLKSRPAQADSLRVWLQSQHSYEVPAIITVPATVNAEYGQWLQSVLG